MTVIYLLSECYKPLCHCQMNAVAKLISMCLRKNIDLLFIHLQGNDQKFSYAVMASVAFAFFKRPWMALMSGFPAGYMFSQRNQLVSDVHTQQKHLVSSYQRMMRNGGVAALDKPEVMELTETVANNVRLSKVQTWTKQDLEPQSQWWGFWRNSPVSSDTQAKLEKLYGTTPQTTDLVVNDINLNKLGEEALKQSKELAKHIPLRVEETIHSFGMSK